MTFTDVLGTVFIFRFPFRLVRNLRLRKFNYIYVQAMKINRNTKIIGQQIILVPYRNYHVPKYHDWMKSEELQQLTASEPLTLEQEYDMQKSWSNDEDKCTFIILDKGKMDQTNNEVEAMIGDTNIFITDRDLAVGEIEIMIAEDSARGKKCGWEAVVLMLQYGIKLINLKSYESKISLTNDISIKMFKKLGFEEKSKSDIFQEITMEKIVDDEWLKWLDKEFVLQLNDYY